jgi:SAM-dependent methyltransferase
MRPSEYAMVFAVENSHWWYTGMQAIVEQLLQEFLPSQRDLQILDAGCGTGGAMVYLANFGPVTGCDYSPLAIDYCQRRQLSRLTQAGVEKLPYAAHSFDLVTSFDVLYHQAVTSYQDALDEFYRVLRPGGHVFLRLPAYDWLRGHHDEVIATARRFTTHDLNIAFNNSRFIIQLVTYVNTLLLPLALAKRIVEPMFPPSYGMSDIYPVPRWLNRLFANCLQAEARWLGMGKTLPFGLTVLAIGKKV